MSDRKLQDAIIRVLADAALRSELDSPRRLRDELGLTDEQAHALSEADGSRVEKFARFLARHYYYERIVRFFKYSRALADTTGRYPESILRSPEFDRLLATCVMGSRETAAAVAHLVESYLTSDAEDLLDRVPYYADLVSYESAMMVVEAGPRTWHAVAAAAKPPDLETVAAPVEGTIVREFDWELPGALPGLLRSPDAPPPAERRSTRLLFARTPRGRVTVMRCSEGLSRLIDAADGRRTVQDLADELGLPAAEVLETVSSVIEAGVLHRMG